MSTSVPKLFQSIQVGDVTLKHRVVLAPLTRVRADNAHVHSEKAVEYYAQRSSTPGTLLITEATFIAQKAGGLSNVPGIWSDEQIAAWKKITDAVHANGSYIYMQLWALGRAADHDQLLTEDPSTPYVSSSDVQLTGQPKPPRPLTEAEIKEYIQLYATAASNAVHKAGFDGVEVHGANGYLIDQFIQSVSNKRTDAYGGSPENRSRFALEILEAVTKAVGETKTGIRLGPWTPFQDMRMPDDDLIATFSHLTTEIRDRFPKLAYLHVVEPRISGNTDADAKHGEESNDFIRDIWGSRPLISAGGYTRKQALEVSERTGNLIGFGRYFISNPDLPLRIKENIEWTPYNRNTFYLPGDTTGKGYTDYPFASQSKATL